MEAIGARIAARAAVAVANGLESESSAEPAGSAHTARMRMHARATATDSSSRPCLPARLNRIKELDPSQPMPGSQTTASPFQDQLCAPSI